MRFYYRDEGGLRTLTSRGQTLHWIWTVSYRLPEGVVGYMLTANDDPTLKTVGPSVFTDRQTDRYTHRQTDRQTDRHTDRQTDMTDFMIVAHPRWATIITLQSHHALSNPIALGSGERTGHLTPSLPP